MLVSCNKVYISLNCDLNMFLVLEEMEETFECLLNMYGDVSDSLHPFSVLSVTLRQSHYCPYFTGKETEPR